MTVFFDISAALDDNLNTMASRPDVAWPNKKYEPVNGTLFLRPTLLPAETTAATIGAGTDLNLGVYQIDIFSPIDKGKSEYMIMSDLVADQFKRDKELTYNGRKVVIKNTSQVNAGNSGEWFHAMIEVTYYSFTQVR